MIVLVRRRRRLRERSSLATIYNRIRNVLLSYKHSLPIGDHAAKNWVSRKREINLTDLASIKVYYYITRSISLLNIHLFLTRVLYLSGQAQGCCARRGYKIWAEQGLYSLSISPPRLLYIHLLHTLHTRGEKSHRAYTEFCLRFIHTAPRYNIQYIVPRVPLRVSCVILYIAWGTPSGRNLFSGSIIILPAHTFLCVGEHHPFLLSSSSFTLLR